MKNELPTAEELLSQRTLVQHLSHRIHAMDGPRHISHDGSSYNRSFDDLVNTSKAVLHVSHDIYGSTHVTGDHKGIISKGPEDYFEIEDMEEGDIYGWRELPQPNDQWYQPPFLTDYRFSIEEITEDSVTVRSLAADTSVTVRFGRDEKQIIIHGRKPWMDQYDITQHFELMELDPKETFYEYFLDFSLQHRNQHEKTAGGEIAVAQEMDLIRQALDVWLNEKLETEFLIIKAITCSSDNWYYPEISRPEGFIKCLKDGYDLGLMNLDSRIVKEMVKRIADAVKPYDRLRHMLGNELYYYYRFHGFHD